MSIDFQGFDWDLGNSMKCLKHGVSVDDIEFIFVHGPVIAPDIIHSVNEMRFIAIGRNKAGRPLFVAFTFRLRGEKRLIRPVSARFMHKKEVEAYEKKSS